MIKNHKLSCALDEKMSKLMPRWIGPFRLGTKLTDVSYEIHSIPENKLICKRHVSDLKPFQIRNVHDAANFPLKSPSNGDNMVIRNVRDAPNFHRNMRKKPRINYRTLAGY